MGDLEVHRNRVPFFEPIADFAVKPGVKVVRSVSNEPVFFEGIEHGRAGFDNMLRLPPSAVLIARLGTVATGKREITSIAPVVLFAVGIVTSWRAHKVWRLYNYNDVENNPPSATCKTCSGHSTGLTTTRGFRDSHRLLPFARIACSVRLK
jgi:hypothetical protein